MQSYQGAPSLKMEAARTPEISVNFYQATQQNNPEDSHFHIRRRENLKSHTEELVLRSSRFREQQQQQLWAV
jgi:hypothetical protein